MTPKPALLGPSFLSPSPLKGGTGLPLLGPPDEGFAHEVLAAIRRPAQPKAPAEAPAELPWAVLLGTPVERPAFPSPGSSPPPRAGARPVGLEPGRLPAPALAATQGRQPAPATRLLREVRADWVALPLPEAGPAPEVEWVEQEPAQATPEPPPEPALEEGDLTEPVETEPLLASPQEAPPAESARAEPHAPRTVAAPEPRAVPQPLEPQPPELELLPFAFEREQVRIRIDSQLAVEVTTRGRHVDVLLSGTHAALEPLRDLAVELGSQLMQDGYSLNDFQTRSDDSSQQHPQDEQEPQEPRAPVRTRRTARPGRYA